MTTYLHPGVYVEEIPSGARPIEGVSTSTAAFVGRARRGTAHVPTLVLSLGEYERTFGPIADADDAMGFAVRTFFLNGGTKAYVCRLTDRDVSEAATRTLDGEAGRTDVLRVHARSVGPWGNELRVRVRKSAADAPTFTLEVGYLDDEGTFTAEETFEDLLLDGGADDAIVRVERESSLVTLTLGANADDEADAGRGTLVGGAVSGDASFYQDGLAARASLSISIDGSDARRVGIGPAADLGLTGDNAADAALVAAALRDAVRDSVPAADGFGDFEIAFDGGTRTFTLTSGTQSRRSSVRVVDGDGSAADLARLLELDTAGDPATTPGYAPIMPAEQLGLSETGVALEDGTDAPPGNDDYVHFFGEVLVKTRDASIIVLPGRSWQGAERADIEAAIAYCQSTQRAVTIVDPPPGTELRSPADVSALGLGTSSYSVLYYPWIEVNNPFHDPDLAPSEPTTVAVAPSALAAGLFARTDARRGVWKAPAGVEATILGAASLEYVVGDAEQDQLNPLGINAIRTLPVAGLSASVIWGSRTLATKADPQYRYVPVRRTSIYIRQSIYNGIQWAVFEPNDHRLWSSLRANIGAFMDGMFRSGAFQGTKASHAYFVACGLGSTMTQDDIDAGRVIVEVGFAPLKPAEFVIVRISQKAGES